MFGAASDTVSSSASNDQIMLALIALVSMSIAALVYIIRNSHYVKTAAEEATAANAAVNNVGPGKHTLYTMVENIHEDVVELKDVQKEFASHGWDTLPPDINTAVGLTTTIRDLQNDHKHANEKLDTIIAELREHVQWEQDEKYGKHGRPQEDHTP